MTNFIVATNRVKKLNNPNSLCHIFVENKLVKLLPVFFFVLYLCLGL